MKENFKSLKNSYKAFILFAIVFIALGITIRNSNTGVQDSLGTVLVAVGGLSLIIGMSKKRKENEKK